MRWLISICFKSHWFFSEYECADSYKTISASTFSNGEIQEGADLTLGSKQSVDHCERKCDKSETCYGFVYIEQTSGASCKLFNALPVLATDNMATVYMKMCPPDTHLEGKCIICVAWGTGENVNAKNKTNLWMQKQLKADQDTFQTLAVRSRIQKWHADLD